MKIEIEVQPVTAKVIDRMGVAWLENAIMTQMSRENEEVA